MLLLNFPVNNFLFFFFFTLFTPQALEMKFILIFIFHHIYSFAYLFCIEGIH